MKQIKLIMTLCCLMMLMGCKSRTFINNSDRTNTLPALSVKGNFLMNSNGDTVILRGVSYGWHNFWPRFYNESSAKYIINHWGADVLRAAMGVDIDKNSYINRPDFGIECVSKIANAAIENGAYVIIDWHCHNLRLNEAKEFFTKMAKRYKGVPNVIYELYNEPINDSWTEVKNYSIELIKTIRAIEPNAVILVGSPHWDQDIHIAADDPITGFKNIMYTLHFYANTHGQSLRDRADYALSKGLPIFVSECAGMEATGDGPINREEWGKWIDWMNKNKISWAAWSIADKNETCSMLYPSASSEGDWKDNNLKEWANIVIEELTSSDFVPAIISE